LCRARRDQVVAQASCHSSPTRVRWTLEALQPHFIRLGHCGTFAAKNIIFVPTFQSLDRDRCSRAICSCRSRVPLAPGVLCAKGPPVYVAAHCQSRTLFPQNPLDEYRLPPPLDGGPIACELRSHMILLTTI
jgi:hypothetical protein